MGAAQQARLAPQREKVMGAGQQARLAPQRETTVMYLERGNRKVMDQVAQCR